MAALCTDSYNPIEFYTKLVNRWGDSDYGYSLILTNEDSSLRIETDVNKADSNDTVFIFDKNGFKPSDIYNIIDSINSQSEFHDLFIAFGTEDEVDEVNIKSVVYHEESFAINKLWINDLMNKFKSGELDNYHSVIITSNFEDLCIESNGNDIENNRLYVMFE